MWDEERCDFRTMKNIRWWQKNGQRLKTTFTYPIEVGQQRQAVTGKGVLGGVKMQIAIPPMQTGECCSLHQTVQFRMNLILHEKTRECGHVKWM